jgi:hypothetical protein
MGINRECDTWPAPPMLEADGDDATAVETPRALTTPLPKKRSGQWEVVKAECKTLPPPVAQSRWPAGEYRFQLPPDSCRCGSVCDCAVLVR